MDNLRKFFAATLVAFLAATAGYAQILPTPTRVVEKEGTFRLTDKTAISYAGPGQQTAQYLSGKLRASTGYALKVVNRKKKSGIHFTTEGADPALGKEGYILDITPALVTIRATTEAGMFYGVQSLLQLFDAEIFSRTPVRRKDWRVAAQSISDKPKYGWRSFMLDSGRQFQSPDFIKKYLDLLALLKMNVFHWHLSEGQGWRLEIKKYPRLTAIGSKVATGEEQQGYYTQQDVRDIVRYAAERHITVVPEIDVPGHSEAALTAYPELTCTKKAPATVMAFSPNLFCGGSEATYDFLENVLDEMVDLFPGAYIHLGGDEAPKKVWDSCGVCQKKIKAEGLRDSHDLQLYFSKRLASYLKSKNRKVIFWGDVVYEDGTKLPDNVVIQWWNWRRHKDLAYRNALKNNYPVIAATNYYCYLNFPVTPWSRYDEARTFDLRTVYEENPSDMENPDPLVMGMSTSLWTDWYVKEDMIDRRVFPRIYALAEQMWHTGPRLSYESFHEAVKSKYPALKILNVNPGPADKEEAGDNYNWE